MSDARERALKQLREVEQIIAKGYDDHPMYPDFVDPMETRDRLLNALRDSEGREEVAEGWILPEHAEAEDKEPLIGVWRDRASLVSLTDGVDPIPVALSRRQEAESPKPSNAARLARVDPRYLRHLRRCEDYAVEQGYVKRTDWESESDTDTGGE